MNKRQRNKNIKNSTKRFNKMLLGNIKRDMYFIRQIGIVIRA